MAGVAVDDYEVCGFARFEGADAVGFAEEFSSILRGDVDSLQRRETRFDEQFGLPLVAEAGEYAPVTSGIFAGKEQASGLDEVALELHFFLEQDGAGAIAFGDTAARVEIVRAGGQRQRLQDALL